MPGVFDYSTTANNNTTVGGVNIAEGMQAGLVNNGIRAMMADSKKWQLDWSGIVTAGAGNVYTITSNQGIAAYADGQRFCFRADRNNTGAATLNVDSRGAKALRKVTGGALAAVAADDIVAEAVYDVVYDLSSDVFVIVGFASPTISAFGLTLLDDADAAAARTTLGLVIGTDVQAKGDDLTAIEALGGTGIAVRTAPDTWAQRTITSADGSVTISNPAGVAGNIDLSAGGWTLVSSSSSWTGGKQTITGLGGYRRVMVALVLGAADAADERILRVGDAGGILSTAIYQRNQGAALTRATLSNNNVTATQSSTIVIEEFNGTGPYKPIIGAPNRGDDTAVGVLTSSALTQIEVSNETGNITSGTLYVWGRT